MPVVTTRRTLATTTQNPPSSSYSSPSTVLDLCSSCVYIIAARPQLSALSVCECVCPSSAPVSVCVLLVTPALLHRCTPLRSISPYLRALWSVSSTCDGRCILRHRRVVRTSISLSLYARFAADSVVRLQLPRAVQTRLRRTSRVRRLNGACAAPQAQAVDLRHLLAVCLHVLTGSRRVL